MEYHNILGKKAHIKKLTTMTDNMADLVSHSMALIMSVQTSVRPRLLDRILEGIKELEAQMASVESRVDKRETLCSNRSQTKSNSKEAMCRLHKKFEDNAIYC